MPGQLPPDAQTLPAARCATAIAACLLAALPAAATPTAPQSPLPAAAPRTPWSPGTADLPADPGLHFGELDNGLRFAWQAHNRPVGSCSLRLVVHVGSLDEDDDQLGMAHFVEHMAFNGTRRFPGNTIDDWLRDHGMRVGQHVNAFTGYEATRYRIDLPRCDEQSLIDGLDVLRQFADHVLFEPDEVQREQGVIDAEQRERATPDEQIGAEVFARTHAAAAPRSATRSAPQRAARPSPPNTCVRSTSVGTDRTT
jgi:zinc protease